ncbi:hypothetical protein BGW42_002432 [Actinomortierella wolfii]|nr:hypothetical protein BGW42_002432 [Actinomortierella wolfii]
MDAFLTQHPSDDDDPSLSQLESIPPECFDHVLDYLAEDCITMHSLMLVNKTLFHRTVPRLYQSPFVAIDSTWPRMSYPARLYFTNEEGDHSTQDTATVASSMTEYTQARSRPPSSRLGQSRQVQLLWVFYNCLVNFESGASEATKATIAALGDQVRPWSLLEQYTPTVDYLSFYTQMNHPGLRFVIIQLFPAIDDASPVEQLLVEHAAEKIRCLFLDWLPMDTLIDMVPRFSSLVSLKLGHEELQVQSAIDFVQKHQQLYGTIMELDIQAYLPSIFEAKMDPAIGTLINICQNLRSLSISGFESLMLDLSLLPTAYLRTLKINCGHLRRCVTDERGNIVELHSEETESTMSIGQFLSRCRSLEHLMLRSVYKGTLDWAVREKRELETQQQHSKLIDRGATKSVLNDTSSVRSFSSNTSASNTTTTSPDRSPILSYPPVALRTIHIAGMDTEQSALVVSQAAEAFADTLESICIDSFSYQSNPTLTEVAWEKPLPRLRHLQLDGRSNLPFRFASLKLCPNLRTLDLSRYIGMRGCPETELLHIQSLKRLERLDLSIFDHLTDWTLDAILSGLTSLRYLRLSLAESTGSMTTSRGTPVASSCPCRKLNAAAIAASLSPLPTVRENEGESSSRQDAQDESGSVNTDKIIHDSECPFSSGPSRNGIMSLAGILASVDRHLHPHLKQLAVILGRKLLDEHMQMLKEYSLRHPDLEVMPFRGAY